MMRTARILALTLAAVAVPAASFGATVRDAVCPNADAPVAALSAAMQQAPGQPTQEVANAATAAYKAYVACGKRYKSNGDLANSVYAAAQSGPIFEFAGHAYHGIGNSAMAISALQYGRTVLQAALATGAGAANLRESIAVELRNIQSLLGEYGAT